MAVFLSTSPSPHFKFVNARYSRARGSIPGFVSRTGAAHRTHLNTAGIAKSAPDTTMMGQIITPDNRMFHTPKAIMMQGFGWDSCDANGWYSILMGQTDAMKEIGVTQLWLPPPSASVSRQGYLPSQLYDLNTPYGSEAELRALIQRLREAGIAPLADIVINHRCADVQDEHGQWNIFDDKVDHPGRSLAWGQWAIVGGDGFGGVGSIDSGADFDPAPDLDHKNAHVRESLKDWLSYLHQDVGYAGWRLDYIKGYASRFVREYIEDTVGFGAPHVGEYWTDMDWEGSFMKFHQNEARQTLCNVLDDIGGDLNLFDFPTKGILQEAIRNCEYWRLADKDNRPPGFMGWWPERAVTFLDNHDTGSTQQHWPFPSNRIMAGYAYILTHPGVPCIFYDHVFKWGLLESISDLVEVRQRNGINSKSKVKILAAEEHMYVARIDDKVTVKLGPQHEMHGLKPSRDQGWQLCSSGDDFAVWERGGTC